MNLFKLFHSSKCSLLVFSFDPEMTIHSTPYDIVLIPSNENMCFGAIVLLSSSMSRSGQVRRVRVK